jgi:HECT-domain (ubiquitin-transferase)/Concanavalin A-like lectin/glucanases superfamily/SPRY domain
MIKAVQDVEVDLFEALRVHTRLFDAERRAKFGAASSPSSSSPASSSLSLTNNAVASAQLDAMHAEAARMRVEVDEIDGDSPLRSARQGSLSELESELVTLRTEVDRRAAQECKLRQARAEARSAKVKKLRDTLRSLDAEQLGGAIANLLRALLDDSVSLHNVLCFVRLALDVIVNASPQTAADARAPLGEHLKRLASLSYFAHAPSLPLDMTSSMDEAQRKRIASKLVARQKRRNETRAQLDEAARAAMCASLPAFAATRLDGAPLAAAECKRIEAELADERQRLRSERAAKRLADASDAASSSAEADEEAQPDRCPNFGCKCKTWRASRWKAGKCAHCFHAHRSPLLASSPKASSPKVSALSSSSSPTHQVRLESGLPDDFEELCVWPVHRFVPSQSIGDAVLGCVRFADRMAAEALLKTSSDAECDQSTCEACTDDPHAATLPLLVSIVRFCCDDRAAPLLAERLGGATGLAYIECVCYRLMSAHLNDDDGKSLSAALAPLLRDHIERRFVALGEGARELTVALGDVLRNAFAQLYDASLRVERLMEWSAHDGGAQKSALRDAFLTTLALPEHCASCMPPTSEALIDVERHVAPLERLLAFLFAAPRSAPVDALIGQLHKLLTRRALAATVDATQWRDSKFGALAKFYFELVLDTCVTALTAIDGDSDDGVDALNNSPLFDAVLYDLLLAANAYCSARRSLVGGAFDALWFDALHRFIGAADNAMEASGLMPRHCVRIDRCQCAAAHLIGHLVVARINGCADDASAPRAAAAADLASRWLDGKHCLLRHGLETLADKKLEPSFLADIVERRGNAAALLDWLSLHEGEPVAIRQVHDERLDRMLRTSFAAVLKHNGRAADAQNLAKQARELVLVADNKSQLLSVSNEPAPPLWMRDMLRHIYTLKARVSGDAGGGGGGDDTSAAWLQRVDACAKRAGFLLNRVQSASSASRPSTSTPSFASSSSSSSSSGEPTLFSPTPSPGRSAEVDAWSKLRHESGELLANRSISQMTKDVVAFVGDRKLDADAVGALLVERDGAAMHRADGFEAASRLLDMSANDGAVYHALAVLPAALRIASSNLRPQRVDAGLEGCSASAKARVRRAYDALMSRLAAMLGDRATPHLLLLAALHTWAMLVDADADRQLLLRADIFGALSALLAPGPSERTSLRSSGTKFFFATPPTFASDATASASPSLVELRTLRSAALKLFRLLAFQMLVAASSSSLKVTDAKTQATIVDVLLHELSSSLQKKMVDQAAIVANDEEDKEESMSTTTSTQTNCQQLLSAPTIFSGLTGTQLFGVIGGACDTARAASSAAARNFSVSMWARFDSAPVGTSRASIFCRGGAQCYPALVVTDGGRVEFWLHARSGALSKLVSSARAPLKRWVHLAAVLKRDAMQLYVDGELAEHALFDGEPCRDDAAVWLGRVRDNPLPGVSTGFHGALANVAYHTRALRASDVAALHAVGVAPDLPDESCYQVLALLRCIGQASPSTLAVDTESQRWLPLVLRALSQGSLRVQQTAIALLGHVLGALRPPATADDDSHFDHLLELLFRQIGCSLDPSLSSPLGIDVAERAYDAQAIAAQVVMLLRSLARGDDDGEAPAWRARIDRLLSASLARARRLVRYPCAIPEFELATKSEPPSATAASKKSGGQGAPLAASEPPPPPPPPVVSATDRGSGFASMLRARKAAMSSGAASSSSLSAVIAAEAATDEGPTVEQLPFEERQPHLRAIADAVAALYVVGAHGDVLRVGGTVDRRLSSSGHQCTVIGYKPSWQFVELSRRLPGHADGDPDRIVTGAVDLHADMQVAEAVPFDACCLPLSVAAALPMLRSLLERLLPSKRQGRDLALMHLQSSLLHSLERALSVGSVSADEHSSALAELMPSLIRVAVTPVSAAAAAASVSNSDRNPASLLQLQRVALHRRLFALSAAAAGQSDVSFDTPNRSLLASSGSLTSGIVGKAGEHATTRTTTRTTIGDGDVDDATRTLRAGIVGTMLDIVGANFGEASCRETLALCEWDLSAAVTAVLENPEALMLAVTEERERQARLKGEMQRLHEKPPASSAAAAAAARASSAAESALNYLARVSGFQRDWCRQALAAESNNVDAALSWLVDNAARLELEQLDAEGRLDVDEMDAEQMVARFSSRYFSRANEWPPAANSNSNSGKRVAGRAFAFADELTRVHALDIDQVRSALYDIEVALSILHARGALTHLIASPAMGAGCMQPALLLRFVKLAMYRAGAAPSAGASIKKALTRLFAAPASSSSSESTALVDAAIGECESSLRRAASARYADVAWGQRQFPSNDFSALSSANVELAHWLLDLIVAGEWLRSDERRTRAAFAAAAHGIRSPNMLLRAHTFNLFASMMASIGGDGNAALRASVRAALPLDKIAAHAHNRYRREIASPHAPLSSYLQAAFAFAAAVEATSKVPRSLLKASSSSSARGGGGGGRSYYAAYAASRSRSSDTSSPSSEGGAGWRPTTKKAVRAYDSLDDDEHPFALVADMVTEDSGVIDAERSSRVLMGSSGSWAYACANKVWKSGLHYWEVTHTSGAWGTTFFGAVPSAEYTAPSSRGLGIINYRATTRRGSEGYYGQHLAVGDRVGVLLDLDLGRMWFLKNGENMGLAFSSNLPTLLRPQLGVQQCGDELRLHGELLSMAQPSVASKIRALSLAHAALRAATHGYAYPRHVLLAAHDAYKEWAAQTHRWHRTRPGALARFRVDDAHCAQLMAAAGFRYGDLIEAPTEAMRDGAGDNGERQTMRVVGEFGGHLWLQPESMADGAWYWHRAYVRARADQFKLLKPAAKASNAARWRLEPIEPLLSFDEFCSQLPAAAPDDGAASSSAVAAAVSIEPLLVKLVADGVPFNCAPARVAAAARAANVDVGAAQARFALLLMIDAQLEHTMALIDFESDALASAPHSLTHCVLARRAWLFERAKTQQHFEPLREATAAYIPATEDEYTDPPCIVRVRLNRTKARRAFAEPDDERRRSMSMFVQSFAALGSGSGDSRALRHEFVGLLDNNQKRCFRVELVGEGADDNGGPYREVFSQYVEELQSNVLPLLVRSSNAQSGYGNEREKWVLNPSCGANVDLRHLRFFGQLLGVALRADITLPLSLPSRFWKHLVGAEPDEADLVALDAIAVRGIRSMLDVDRDTFDECYADATWSYTTTSGGHVPLRSGGLSRYVEFEERAGYVRASLHARLHESAEQMRAVLSGLHSVLPRAALRPLTWRQAERLVCGPTRIDVKLLRANTVYEDGVSPEEPHIYALWQALERFTDEQRSRFLQFVWARKSLPSSRHAWTGPFVIKPASNYAARDNPDAYLMSAATCFFTLYLPRYSSADILYARLVQAIDNCASIDMDVRVTQSQVAEAFGD